MSADNNWRVESLAALQEHYASFAVFLRDIMWFLGGWKPTWLQYDIANYLQYGPNDLMVQAQRGEAKSTITAIFAVWCIMMNPKYRVLIVSAGGKQANEIANLVTKIIMFWDPLECIRPDKSAGDRTSVEAFDVHYSLKGVDKSPSVACIGITGNLPGKRADLLIADDIESPKNSMTAGNREMLLTLSLEFSAIASGQPGIPPRIVYLGTPQTSESIYNTLPGRGFDVRIWPGRFPTISELPNYGPHLAPQIRNAIEAEPSLQFGGGMAGDMGKPTDPDMFDEEMLQRKFADRGASSFQLNYMLNTKLMDAMRFPLKTENIIVMPGSPTGKVPSVLNRGIGAAMQKVYQSSGLAYTFSQPMIDHENVTYVPFDGIHMQVDPAGGGANGDETGFAITAYANSTIYVLAIGGIPGGYGDEQMLMLAKLADKFKVNTISIEKNYGYGAFAKVWLPILHKEWKGTILEPYVGGQKETRMIGTLEPIMGRGSLVFYESAIDMDHDLTEPYNTTGHRKVYSVLHQLTKLQNVKRCLKHDDRLDALEGSVRYWMDRLKLDQHRAKAIEDAKAYQKWLDDPVGWSKNQRPLVVKAGNTSNKYF
ncbi:terminase large subunit [Stenotrophomonas phage Pepon]|uniref:Terminase large subunit n=1 Tax=Stenotrophomonas phage Pepon TaxID=2859654 RepID=A0AAE7WM46_9CAUD|nr:terminase large subunit [Stenotrophomonas phage Pepon]